MSNLDDYEDLEEHSLYSKDSHELPLDPSIKVWVTVDGFGTIVQPSRKSKTDYEAESIIVQRYTFRNRNKMTVQVITYGATITSIKVPDKYGHPDDILMGFDTLEEYIEHSDLQFGCTIRGDYKNPGTRRNEITYPQSKHDCEGDPLAKCSSNRLDTSVWTPHLSDNVLTLTIVTDCSAMGYPGRLMARATFELKNNNTFLVSYGVTTSKSTPVNLFNQLFVNLAGHGAGHQELYKHFVTLNADRIVVNGEDEMPNGKIECVGGTINDLRIPHELGPAISRCPLGGYDEYMCLIQGTEQSLTFVARVLHPKTGRVLEIYSDQPGCHFYTANRFPDPLENIHPDEVYSQDYFEIPSANLGRLRNMPDDDDDVKSTQLMLEQGCGDEQGEGEGEYDMSDGVVEPINGKGGALYMRNGAFNISTQQYPNAAIIPEFPNIILHPGHMYKHEIMYNFGLYLGNMEPVTLPFCEEVEEEGNEEEIKCFPI